MTQMTAPSAVPDTFSENKILYKKEMVNGEEIFVFSTNPEDELFSVRFTLVGDNLGNYILNTSNAINRIFEYVLPINGVPQGNYEPIIQLKCSNEITNWWLKRKLSSISEKTNIDFEVAGSKNDLNLFSKLEIRIMMDLQDESKPDRLFLTYFRYSKSRWIWLDRFCE